MAQANNIIQELNELESSLANDTLSTAYQAPAGYFENLAAEILRRAKADAAATATEELAHLSPLLSQFSRKTPYTVPTGYFEELEPLLSLNTDQPAAEELETLSPLLSGLKKQMPYTVPDGYFDTVISSGTGKDRETGAKVISLTQHKWFRYAAAAMVTGLVAISALFIFNRPEKIDPSTRSYAWVEKNMQKVSTETIGDFVEAAKEDLAVQEGVSAELNTLMKDVSDTEIQEFLNETGVAEPEAEDDLFLN